VVTINRSSLEGEAWRFSADLTNLLSSAGNQQDIVISDRYFHSAAHERNIFVSKHRL
jgi:thymidylate kinase